MKERPRVLAWALMIMTLFVWLRFLFHSDPRLPGSFVGSMLGIAGAVLMTVPLAYTVAKRLFHWRGERLRTFLAVHIYAGFAGAILAILHTGHKFDNPLGVVLTAMMLIVVLSGFVGRYLLQECSLQLSDKRRGRDALEPAFTVAHREVLAAVDAAGYRTAGPAVWLSALCPWAVRDRSLRAATHRALGIVDAMSSLETSIAMHERLQQWFRRWIRFHLTLTFVFYFLLAGHVVIVAYYGLRWWGVE